MRVLPAVESSRLMQSYNNVAELRHFRGAFCTRNAAATRNCALRGSCRGAIRGIWTQRGSAAGSVDLDVEVADLLAQGIAVEAEQIRRPDLVAPGCGQRRRQQRNLDFPQDK
jgi:hypothetical protein